MSPLTAMVLALAAAACSADRMSRSAADVADMRERLTSLSGVGRAWARSVADAVAESGAEGKNYGATASTFADGHAAIIDEVFSVTALAQSAAKRSASLLEETEGQAPLPHSFGAESLDHLSELLDMHEKHAKTAADTHKRYTDKHAEVVKLHGITGLMTLVEVAEHGQVGELGAAGRTKGIVTRALTKLKQWAGAFLRAVKKAGELFKRAMLFLRKLLLHVLTHLYMGAGVKADALPVPGVGPVLQICFGATELVLGPAGPNMKNWIAFVDEAERLDAIEKKKKGEQIQSTAILTRSPTRTLFEERHKDALLGASARKPKAASSTKTTWVFIDEGAQKTETKKAKGANRRAGGDNLLSEEDVEESGATKEDEVGGLIGGAPTNGGLSTKAQTEAEGTAVIDELTRGTGTVGSGEAEAETEAETEATTKKSSGTFAQIRAATLKGLVRSFKEGSKSAVAMGSETDKSAQGIKVCLNIGLSLPTFKPSVQLTASLGLSMFAGFSKGIKTTVRRFIDDKMDKLDRETRPLKNAYQAATENLYYKTWEMNRMSLHALARGSDQTTRKMTLPLAQEVANIKTQWKKKGATYGLSNINTLNALVAAEKAAKKAYNNKYYKTVNALVASHLPIFVADSIANLLQTLAGILATVLGRSTTEPDATPDDDAGPKMANTHDESDLLELAGLSTASLAKRAASLALSHGKSGHGESGDTDRSTKDHRDAFEVCNKCKAKNVLEAPVGGSSARLGEKITVSWDQRALDDAAIKSGQKAGVCDKIKVMLASDNTGKLFRKRVLLYGSWSLDRADLERSGACPFKQACKKPGAKCVCSWDWIVQSSVSRGEPNKQGFKALSAHSKGFYFTIWCGDKVRSTSNPRFKITDGVVARADSKGKKSGGSACRESMMLTFGITPGLVYPVGIDFDLVQCGAEALAKIKGVFSSLGKKKKAQSEDDDDSAVSGGNGKVDTYSAFLEQGAGADDDAELQETDEQERENKREARAAEEQAVLSSSLGRTSGVESGMGDALKEKPCRRLNAFGSVLIDLTAANPIILTVMKYYTLAHAAHLAYTAIVVGRQIAGFTPVTKAELTTVLASVLKQSKYHDANDNYVSTSHPKVRAFMDLVPNTGPLTAASMEYLLLDTRKMAAADRDVYKYRGALKDAIGRVSAKSKATAWGLDSAQTARSVYFKFMCAEVADNTVTAANSLPPFVTGPSLSFLMAAHFGPIHDAAKCMYVMGKGVVRSLINRLSGKSKCVETCALPPAATPPVDLEKKKKGGEKLVFVFLQGRKGRRSTRRRRAGVDQCAAILKLPSDAGDADRLSLPRCIAPTGRMLGGKADTSNMEGKCMFCLGLNQECAGHLDCSSGLCAKSRCVRRDQPGGTKCREHAQCSSQNCVRKARFMAGACAVLDKQRCAKPYTGMGGCRCIKNSECVGSNACFGAWTGPRGIPVFSKGACEGPPPPPRCTAKTERLDCCVVAGCSWVAGTKDKDAGCRAKIVGSRSGGVEDACGGGGGR